MPFPSIKCAKDFVLDSVVRNGTAGLGKLFVGLVLAASFFVHLCEPALRRA